MAINLQRANKMGRALILLCLLALAGIVIFRYYKNNPGTGLLSAPKEYQLNYMPADYDLPIDIDDAIAIASNPQRYRREFDQMVFDINVSVLRHVGRRMGLKDSLQTAVIKEYETNHHDYLKSLYYNDFIKLRDSTAAIYETWYENDNGSATRVFKEVTSKYTCYLVNQVLATVIPTKGGAVYAKGKTLDTPCGIALTEALGPMIARMEERAAIEDFGRARGLLQEKVERVIAELATMEVRDKKGLSKQMQTKIWGMNVSSTDLEITAISILKVGFKLDDYFDIKLNSKANIVTITLPEPVILSHEVYPKVEKLDIGWLREVESANFNEAFNSLRKEFRREADESGIKDKSKQRVVELMNTMFGPLVKSMNGKYELKVVFSNATGQEAPAKILAD